MKTLNRLLNACLIVVLLTIGLGIYSARANSREMAELIADGFVKNSSGLLLLQPFPSHCPAGTNRSILISFEAPIAWVGCWSEKNGKVTIIDEEGDKIVLPSEQVTWTKKRF